MYFSLLLTAVVHSDDRNWKDDLSSDDRAPTSSDLSNKAQITNNRNKLASLAYKDKTKNIVRV